MCRLPRVHHKQKNLQNGLTMTSKIPRGIRNNNPGNIRRNHIKWKGLSETQTDPSFAQFETPFYGLRAMMKVLVTYYTKHNLKSLKEIINRYAPHTENPTSYYVKCVMLQTNTPSETEDVPVNCPYFLADLAKAMVNFENGWPREPYYPNEVYQRAALAALNIKE